MKKLIITACALLSLNSYALDIKNTSLSHNKTSCGVSLGSGQIMAITAVNHKRAMGLNIEEYVEIDEDNVILNLGVKQSVTDAARMVLLRGEAAIEHFNTTIEECSGDDKENAEKMKKATQEMIDDAQKTIDLLEED